MIVYMFVCLKRCICVLNAINFCIVLCCIALCCVVLYCIVWYCIVLHCVVLYCIVLYCIVLHCIVLYINISGICKNNTANHLQFGQQWLGLILDYEIYS